MDVRTIRYFLEVAKELNITKAAEKLNMSQPPLSRQIQQLEEELGVSLFFRDNRRLTLTEEGELLKNRGEQILSLMEKTEHEVRESGNRLSGTLYIASVEGSGPIIMSNLVSRFHRVYPEVHYNLWNGNGDDVTARLEKGLCDIALIMEPFNNEEFESIPVGSENWIAMLPEKHPLAIGGDTIELEALADQPLILPSRKSRVQEIGEWFPKDTSLNVICQVGHYLNAYELTRNGVGIALFPASSGLSLENQGVVSKKIVNPERMASYVIIWNKQRKLSPISRKFIESIQKEKNIHEENKKDEK